MRPHAAVLDAIRAYVECGDEMREVVREMLRIATSRGATREEREAAIATAMEALYPGGPSDWMDQEGGERGEGRRT